jgi:hypothetical protein
VGGHEHEHEHECRYRGFWWSPDSKRIVYGEADETVVPKYDILHLGKEDPTHSETHRYPFAGKQNPIVRLAVVEVDFASAAAAAASAASVTTPASSSSPSPSWLQLLDAADPAYTTIAALGLCVAALPPVAEEEEKEKDSGKAAGASTASQDIGDVMDYYVARVGWWSDGSVMAQVRPWSWFELFTHTLCLHLRDDCVCGVLLFLPWPCIFVSCFLLTAGVL